MRTYPSNEAFFAHLEDFIHRLEAAGRTAPAKALREGVRLVTGLTDSWALLLAAAEAVLADPAAGLSGAERRELAEFRAALRKAVFR